MRAKITTHHASRALAESMEKALRVDNQDAPPPLRIRSQVRGRTISFTIAGAQDIESFQATVDDLLLCLIGANDTLGEFEEKLSERRARD